MEQEPLYTAQGNPYWSPSNIVCGEARVFWGSERWGDPPNGWWTPGGFVRSRSEAERIVARMAELMNQGYANKSQRIERAAKDRGK